MTTFGIRHGGNVKKAHFYVAEDDVLWDWLHADSVEYVGYYMSVAVAAPDGYVFNAARAMVKYLPSYGEVGELPNNYPSFTRRQYLPSSFTLVSAKALMLISEYSNVLTSFNEEDFEALLIEESRVWDFPVPTVTSFKEIKNRLQQKRTEQ